MSNLSARHPSSAPEVERALEGNPAPLTERTALARRLDALATAADGTERSAAVRRLVRWVRFGPVADQADRAARVRALDRRDARFELLIVALQRSPELRRRVVSALRGLVRGVESIGLFGESGIPSSRGFFAELSDRVALRVLPRPRKTPDLATIVHRVYRTTAEADLLAGVSGERFARLVEVLSPAGEESPWEPLRAGFADAFRLILIRTSHEGLRPPLRQRGKPRPISASPFLALVRSGEGLISRWLAGAGLEAPSAEFTADLAAVRGELALVRARMESEGISVDLEFSLLVLERCLDRLELMAEICGAAPGAAHTTAVRRFLASLVRAAAEDRSILHLLARGLTLLLRKIVDRSGAAGEHYVARTLAEYRGILIAAAGGGLLTTLTAAVKLTVHQLHLAPFGEGVLYSLNYAVSFLLLQRWHLALATKQPAMTAAKLASILRDRKDRDSSEEIVDYAAQICSSQLASAISNVLAVATGAVVFERLWHWLVGRPFLAHDDAEHLFATFSPLDSGTVFYAALTGILLWLGSLAGGWMDNFSVYHDLPEAIAQHPLGHRLGRDRLARWGESVRANVSGWGTNVALGFLLGMTPALGRILGMPLDVRHVTLNSGVVALAASSLGEGWQAHGWFVRALLGVGTMFALNLSVSFALSLLTAARAYGLGHAGVLALLAATWRRWTRHPGEFLLPPRKERGAAK